MAKYKVTNKKTGKVYEYEYPRRRFSNNSPEYNKEYYKNHRNEIKDTKKKKSRNRNLDEKLSIVLKEKRDENGKGKKS